MSNFYWLPLKNGELVVGVDRGRGMSWATLDRAGNQGAVNRSEVVDQRAIVRPRVEHGTVVQSYFLQKTR